MAVRCNLTRDIYIYICQIYIFVCFFVMQDLETDLGAIFHLDLPKKVDVPGILLE